MTTEYLPGFKTQADAEARAAGARRAVQAELRNPLAGHAWPPCKHPRRDEWALAVEHGDRHLLTAAEVAALQTEAQMRRAGWFAPAAESGNPA